MEAVQKQERTYLCIDGKSFYASVECAERGLNPFETNLVVADPARGKHALCLAISPKMKALGVKNRCGIATIRSCLTLKRMKMSYFFRRSLAMCYGIPSLPGYANPV